MVNPRHLGTFKAVTGHYRVCVSGGVSVGDGGWDRAGVGGGKSESGDPDNFTASLEMSGKCKLQPSLKAISIVSIQIKETSHDSLLLKY